MTPPVLAILLSTYNGDKYLEVLLESLQLQEFQNWVLWVRDDGSTDKTLDIIGDFKTKNPNKVKLIESHENLTCI